MGREGVGLAERANGALADEIDERVTETQGAVGHGRDVILAAACASTSTRSTLDQSPVFYRSAPAADPPPLYLHGVPTSSDDWSELLETHRRACA